MNQEFRKGKKLRVNVTELQISKPFLKIRCHEIKPLPSCLLHLGKIYAVMKPLDEIDEDVLYIAHLEEKNYKRCRVLEIESHRVKLDFIDAGYSGKLPIDQIRILPEATEAYEVAPLAKEYIISEIMLSIEEDYRQKMIVLREKIVNKYVEITFLERNAVGIYVDVMLEEESLVDIVFNDPILPEWLKKVPLIEQIEQMLTIYREKRRSNFDLDLCPDSPPKTRVRSKSVSSAYDSACPIKVGNIYEAKIVCYEDGPHKFYVRFDVENEAFYRFCDDIRKVPLHSAEKPIVIGRKYLALEGDKVSRVKVMEVNEDETCLVHYEDEGSKKILSTYILFIVPQDFKAIAPFAKKFSLSEVSSLEHPSKDEVDFYFKHITHKRKILLRPNSEVTDKNATCMLDIDAKSCVLEMLKNFNPRQMKYQKQVSLTCNSEYNASITHVQSPKLFFVNVESTEKQQFLKMKEKFENLKSCQLLNPPSKCACCVEINNINHRACFLNKAGNNASLVELIDMGELKKVPNNRLNVIVEEFTKIQPLAFKCCLKKYEDSYPSAEEESKMKNIDKNKILAIHVHNIKGDLHYVSFVQKDNENSSGSESESESETFLNSFKENTSIQVSISSQSGNKRKTPCQQLLGSNVPYRATPAKKSRISEKVPPIASGWTDSEHSETEIISEQITIPVENWSDDEGQKRLPSERAFKNIAFANYNPQDWDEEGLPKLLPFASTHSEESEETVEDDGYATEKVNEAFDPNCLAKISHFNSPLDFTMQLTSTLKEYEAYKKQLQEEATEQPPLSNFQPFSNCIAKSLSSNEWYRGVILSPVFENEGLRSIKVRNIDNGEETIYENSELLREVPISSLLKHPFGIRCMLPVKIKKKHLEESKNFFLHFLNETFVYKIAAVSSKINFVELMCNGKSLADELVNAGSATRLKKVENMEAYIVHIESLTEFYVHMKSSDENVSKLKKFAEHFKKGEKIAVPVIGSIVMAKYVNGYYRAKVITIINEKITVRFIDFGNVEVVDELFKIDDESIESIEPCADQCALALPKNLNPYTSAAKELFVKIADDGGRAVILRTIEPKLNYSVVNVHLKDDVERDILKELCDLCEPCLNDPEDSTILESTANTTSSSSSDIAV